MPGNLYYNSADSRISTGIGEIYRFLCEIFAETNQVSMQSLRLARCDIRTAWTTPCSWRTHGVLSRGNFRIYLLSVALAPMQNTGSWSHSILISSLVKNDQSIGTDCLRAAAAYEYSSGRPLFSSSPAHRQRIREEALKKEIPLHTARTYQGNRHWYVPITGFSSICKPAAYRNVFSAKPWGFATAPCLHLTVFGASGFFHGKLPKGNMHRPLGTVQPRYGRPRNEWIVHRHIHPVSPSYPIRWTAKNNHA